MNILVVGASSSKSIGHQVGEHLRKTGGHKLKYACRVQKTIILGLRPRPRFVALDATDPSWTYMVFERIKPDVVIHVAGTYTTTRPIGEIGDWGGVYDHILAKSHGVLSVLDAAARVGTVRHMILLGGREVSGHKGYAAYTCGNGAMWALTQFAARHVRYFKTYFIDMPLVEGTAMAKKYLQDPATVEYLETVPEIISVNTISISVVIAAVEAILRDEHASGDRIVLGNKKWTT